MENIQHESHEGFCALDVPSVINQLRKCYSKCLLLLLSTYKMLVEMMNDWRSFVYFNSKLVFQRYSYRTAMLLRNAYTMIAGFDFLK